MGHTKLTGDKNKRFAQLLHDEKIAIKKIFMTATERQFVGDTTNLMSMDDENIYGRVIDQLSFVNALEQKPPILCNYGVITLSITEKEIEEMITSNSLTKANGKDFTFVDDSTTFAALIARKELSKEKRTKHTILSLKKYKQCKEFTELNNF